MDNTTQSTNTQEKMSPDALSATLAHATNLQEQSMPQAQEEQPQNAPVSSQEPQGEAQPQETTNEPFEPEMKGMAKLEGKLEQGIKDLGDMVRAGFDSLVKSKDDEPGNK